MGDRTGIEWTDATWNPMTGCTKATAGCDHCYAATIAASKTRAIYLRQLPVRNTDKARADPFAPRFWPQRLDQPLHWREPRRVFVNSMSDVFHAHFGLEMIQQVFEVMNRAPRHQFQVLGRSDRPLVECDHNAVHARLVEARKALGITFEFRAVYPARLLVQALRVPARFGHEVARSALRRCCGHGVHEDGNVRAVDRAVFRVTGLRMRFENEEVHEGCGTGVRMLASLSSAANDSHNSACGARLSWIPTSTPIPSQPEPKLIVAWATAIDHWSLYRLHGVVTQNHFEDIPIRGTMSDVALRFFPAPISTSHGCGIVCDLVDGLAAFVLRGDQAVHAENRYAFFRRSADKCDGARRLEKEQAAGIRDACHGKPCFDLVNGHLGSLAA